MGGVTMAEVRVNLMKTVGAPTASRLAVMPTPTPAVMDASSVKYPPAMRVAAMRSAITWGCGSRPWTNAVDEITGAHMTFGLGTSRLPEHPT